MYAQENAELSVTWALGLDERLLIVQTVAPVLRSSPTFCGSPPLGGAGREGVAPCGRPGMESGAEGHDGL